MAGADKPLVWMHGEVKTPPFSSDKNWRIVCRVDPDAIIVVEAFPKRTQQTPAWIIDTCQRCLRSYDALG